MIRCSISWSQLAGDLKFYLEPASPPISDYCLVPSILDRFIPICKCTLIIQLVSSGRLNFSSGLAALQFVSPLSLWKIVIHEFKLFLHLTFAKVVWVEDHRALSFALALQSVFICNITREQVRMQKRQNKNRCCLDDLIWSGIWKFVVIHSCFLLSFGISILSSFSLQGLAKR